MKTQLLTLTLVLSAAALVGCQAPPQVAAPSSPFANAQWNTHPLPQRIEVSDSAMILVFENSRTEIPWRLVDSFIEDRTRWYIRPEGGETQPARLEGTP
jgi:hypothetical protein